MERSARATPAAQPIDRCMKESEKAQMRPHFSSRVFDKLSPYFRRRPSLVASFGRLALRCNNPHKTANYNVHSKSSGMRTIADSGVNGLVNLMLILFRNLSISGVLHSKYAEVQSEWLLKFGNLIRSLSLAAVVVESLI